MIRDITLLCLHRSFNSCSYCCFESATSWHSTEPSLDFRDQNYVQILLTYLKTNGKKKWDFVFCLPLRFPSQKPGQQINPYTGTIFLPVTDSQFSQFSKNQLTASVSFSQLILIFKFEKKQPQPPLKTLGFWCKNSLDWNSYVEKL